MTISTSFHSPSGARHARMRNAVIHPSNILPYALPSISTSVSVASTKVPTRAASLRRFAPRLLLSVRSTREHEPVPIILQFLVRGDARIQPRRVARHQVNDAAPAFNVRVAQPVISVGCQPCRADRRNRTRAFTRTFGDWRCGCAHILALSCASFSRHAASSARRT